MKYTLIIWFMIFMCSSFHQNCYQQTIYDRAQIWKSNHQATLNNPAHVQILIDMLLLSYQVAQESCRMIIAKLMIQEELLKIYTPSLIDSWQTNMQVLLNDMTKIEQALLVIKTCQIQFAKLFDQLKQIGPRIIQINPQPTQTIITDLKEGLIMWTKQQDDISDQIDIIQSEFTTAIETISDIKTLFSITLQNPSFDNAQLKQAAGCVSKTYKDIEHVFKHFTQIRATNIYRMKEFFTCFFKTYYIILYDILTPEQRQSHKTLATYDQKLPDPHDFFGVCAIL